MEYDVCPISKILKKHKGGNGLSWLGPSTHELNSSLKLIEAWAKPTSSNLKKKKNLTFLLPFFYYVSPCAICPWASLVSSARLASKPAWLVLVCSYKCKLEPPFYEVSGRVDESLGSIVIPKKIVWLGCLLFLFLKGPRVHWTCFLAREALSDLRIDSTVQTAEGTKQMCILWISNLLSLNSNTFNILLTVSVKSNFPKQINKTLFLDFRENISLLFIFIYLFCTLSQIPNALHCWRELASPKNIVLGILFTFGKKIKYLKPNFNIKEQQ